MSAVQELETLIAELVRGVDLSSRQPNKFDGLAEALATHWGLPPGAVAVKCLAARKNYGNRISEATRHQFERVLVLADQPVDRAALARDLSTRSLRIVPTLLAELSDDLWRVTNAYVEAEQTTPFPVSVPVVEVERISSMELPGTTRSDLVRALVEFDGAAAAARPLDAVTRGGRPVQGVAVKRVSGLKHLHNRVSEALGRRPPVLIVEVPTELWGTARRVIAAQLETATETSAVLLASDGLVWRAESLVAAQDPFVAWNRALLNEFFSPAFDDDFVFLAVGRDELHDIAPELGGFEGLRDAVRDGPSWMPFTPTTTLQTLVSALVRQRTSARRPPGYVEPSGQLQYAATDDRMPTYLPVLAFLVAVFTEHEERGFYEELKSELRLTHQFSSTQLERVNEAWADLRRWSCDECHGRYGRLRDVFLGQLPHTGRLRAHGVFRAHDHEKLRSSFSANRLRPGDTLTGSSLSKLLDHIAGRRDVSVGLAQAAASTSYRAVLQERLQDELDAWDGRSVGSPGKRRADDTDPTNRQEADGAVGLTLGLTDNEPPWVVGLSVPGELDERAEARSGAGTWQVDAVLRDRTLLRPAEGTDGAALLAGSDTAARTVCVGNQGENDAEALFRLAAARLRFFLLEGDVQRLVEVGSLPNHGPAYVLVGPGLDHFERVVDNLDVRVEEVTETTGLPDRWRMFLFRDCSELPGASIAELPGLDPEAAPPRHRALRLVGGVRIVRGGRHVFLPYDLPLLELDAPEGATLACEGLRVTEVTSPGQAGILAASSIRRFAVEPFQRDRHRFEIVAGLDGERIGTCNLRLAVTDDAPHVEVAFGLGRHGVAAEEWPYLAGVRVERLNSGWELGVTLQVQPHELGRLLAPDEVVKAIGDLPEARLLDSIHASGGASLRYGEVRDRLRRYLDGAHRRASSVTRLLGSLRRRGLIEVRSDRRGRWASIGKVPPTLYRLPFDVGRVPAWGIAGTISLAHWERIIGHGVVIRVERAEEDLLPVVRVFGDDECVHGIGGFEVVGSPPALEIAEFSASLAELRDGFVGQGFESVDQRAAGRMRWFSPLRAEWLPASTGLGVDWELYQYEDPDTRAHWLQVLRADLGGGITYRHVRDERWGAWVAYDAAVRWYETRFPGSGLAPWPIHYEPQAAVLWLPERMRLPVLLERALTAASGGPPERVKLQRTSGAGESLVAETTSGRRLGGIGRCYDELLPADHARAWLAHRHVPREVAELVASKLGCRLSDLHQAT